MDVRDPASPGQYLDNAWVIDQFWIDEVPQMPLLEAWTTPP